jgi:hypothetical protein
MFLWEKLLDNDLKNSTQYHDDNFLLLAQIIKDNKKIIELLEDIKNKIGGK